MEGENHQAGEERGKKHEEQPCKHQGEGEEVKEEKAMQVSEQRLLCSLCRELSGAGNGVRKKERHRGALVD